MHQRLYHSFLSSTDRYLAIVCYPKKRDEFVESLQVALDGEIQECISGSGVSDCGEFAARIVVACQNFVVALGIPSLQRRLNIASSLEEVMEVYGSRDRQGFPILNDID